jgi:predicted GTPase
MIMLVDTPGPLDTEGRDEEFWSSMLRVFKNLRFAHTIVLCINSGEERFNSSQTDSLAMYI